MTLSKTERILAIINFFLPHTDLYQYHFEADSIAYNTRKNSTLKTVEKLVREYLPEVDEEMVRRMAVAIRESLYNGPRKTRKLCPAEKIVSQ